MSLPSDKLTVSYKQIASIPIGVRQKAATNGLADLFASALTPGQRAALFPSYYKNSAFTSSSGPATQVASLEPTPSTGSMVQPSDVKPLEKAGIQKNLVPVGMIPGPDGKPMRPADQSITTASDPSTRTDGSLSWRNNNPGNLRYGDFAKAHGAIGERNGFAVFPSVEAGRSAQESLLFKTDSYSTKSIRDALYRYSPPSDGNNTEAYIADIAAKLGVSPSTNMADLTPEQRTAMLDAMQQHEGWIPGKEPSSNDPVTATATPVDNVYNTEPNATPVTATALPEPNTVPASQIAGTSFVAPVNGTFEGTQHSNYGAGRGSYDAGGASQHGPKTRKHSGSDWQAPNGSTAVFPVNGTIVHAGHHSGYGYMVDLKGDDGKVYRMATHGPLAQSFKVGQQVKQGDAAGTIAEGHLHMEIIPSTKNGKPNPVYAEFDREVSSGSGGFVSTSNQRGTVDQEEELGLKKGTSVSQGTPIQTAQLAESVQTASATPTTAPTTETYKMDRKKTADMIRATPEFKKAGFLASLASDDQILDSPQFKKSMADRGVTVNADGTITIDKTAKGYDADALKTFQSQGIITPTQVADASSVMPKPTNTASDVGSSAIPPAPVANVPATTTPPKSLEPAPSAQPQSSTPLTTPPRPMDIRSGLNVARGAAIPPSMTSALERANGKALDESWGYQGTSPGI